ncbi:hypothetical protein CSV77_15420, partial [Sporosarcina sp. P16b]|uniref:hypothetical protein n=1 Tax=Sporosarcina sp. P16b TaxID=2048261 RepID=UPI000C570412
NLISRAVSTTLTDWWLSLPLLLALLSAFSGSKLRTSGSFFPQYSGHLKNSVLPTGIFYILEFQNIGNKETA